LGEGVADGARIAIIQYRTIRKVPKALHESAFLQSGRILKTNREGRAARTGPKSEVWNGQRIYGDVIVLANGITFPRVIVSHGEADGVLTRSGKNIAGRTQCGIVWVEIPLIRIITHAIDVHTTIRRKIGETDLLKITTG
jgi:hypothetical protein